MRNCDAEMCPYWTGDGCACSALGIGRDIDPDAQADFIRNLEEITEDIS